MTTPSPAEYATFLKEASSRAKTASWKQGSMQFVSQVCGTEWDSFIQTWAPICYAFVAEALGPYQQPPQPIILPMSDGAHAAGANASFEPGTGQIRLHPSVVEGKPGITLEKLTHELVHASLASFPEGDPYYEEGFVDYSVWCMAHAPIWGEHRAAMIEAAQFNIQCRRDRALKTQTDYDRKRWSGGLYAAAAYGPWLVTRLRMKKMEGDLTW